MKTRIHAIASSLALLVITLFFTSSLVVELLGDKVAVATVKQWIVNGLFVLVPLMLVTGLSGNAVVGLRRGRLITTKQKRMVAVAINGLLILVPSALILQRMAVAGRFDSIFYLIQGIEFAAGAANIVLMGLNMRDGFRLTGRLRKKRRSRHALASNSGGGAANPST